MTSIKLKIDLSKAKEKINKTKVKRGQLAIANQALIDMDPYIPLKRGPLRLSGHVTGNGSQIVYNTPYARAQFYGGAYNKYRSFSFSEYSTPGTGKRWDLKAKPLHANKWAEIGLKAMGIK